MLKKRGKCHLIVNLALIIILLLVVAESYLRSHNFSVFIVHEPEIADKDRFAKYLGWENKPNMKQTSRGEEPVPGQENVDHLGRRYNGKDVQEPAKRLLFLGCSYTFGQEVADEETYVYKTSRQFPQWQFDNYAVPGYAAHQCRFLLEKILSKPNCPRYDYVFYAFMNDHPHRIAYENQIITNEKNQNRGIMPFADFSWFGTLRYHELDAPLVPGATFLRLSAFLHNLYAPRKTKTDQTFENRSRVYNAVIKDMLNLAKKHDLDLSVLVLDESEFNIDQKIINNGLSVYDIELKGLYGPDGLPYHVDNNIDRHPNGLAHDYWAEKLGNVLNEKIR